MRFVDVTPWRWVLVAGASLWMHAALVLLPRWAPGEATFAGYDPTRSIVSFDVPGDGDDGVVGPHPVEEQAAPAPIPAMPAERPRRIARDEPRVDVVPEQVTTVEDATDAVKTAPEPAPPAATVVPDPARLANDLFVQALIQRPTVAGNGGRGGGGGGGGMCGDPILGVWRAQRFDPLTRRHVVFTIRVTDRDGDRVHATLVNRSWSGGRSQTTPPLCIPGVVDDTTTMTTRGRLTGSHFHLDALSHRRTTNCSASFTTYFLDHFDGELDGDVLRTVNNDGAADIEQPYLFFRTSCR